MRTAVYTDVKGRNKPSLFAPPVAWAVADFSQLLIENDAGLVPDRTGIVLVSDECSLSTIREVSRAAARGSVSPLRFAGASPSVLAGLPAMEQGLRGPTLCLTMPPVHAAGPLAALIRCWTLHCDVAAVLAIAHHELEERRHLLRGLIARGDGGGWREELARLLDSRAGGTE